jgi:hypothetical protein
VRAVLPHLPALADQPPARLPRAHPAPHRGAGAALPPQCLCPQTLLRLQLAVSDFKSEKNQIVGWHAIDHTHQRVFCVQVPKDSRSDMWCSFDGKGRQRLCPGCAMSIMPCGTCHAGIARSVDGFVVLVLILVMRRCAGHILCVWTAGMRSSCGRAGGRCPLFASRTPLTTGSAPCSRCGLLHCNDRPAQHTADCL